MCRRQRPRRRCRHRRQPLPAVPPVARPPVPLRPPGAAARPATEAAPPFRAILPKQSPPSRATLPKRSRRFHQWALRRRRAPARPLRRCPPSPFQGIRQRPSVRWSRTRTHRSRAQDRQPGQRTKRKLVDVQPRAISGRSSHHAAKGGAGAKPSRNRQPRCRFQSAVAPAGSAGRPKTPSRFNFWSLPGAGSRHDLRRTRQGRRARGDSRRSQTTPLGIRDGRRGHGETHPRRVQRLLAPGGRRGGGAWGTKGRPRRRAPRTR